MNLNQLSYVIALAETHNFSKAAEQLFISQPTLSQQIKELENEFDTQFFERSRRDISLTPAGTELLHYAQRILSDVEKMKLALGQYRSSKVGALKIGVLWTFGYIGVDSCIKAFSDQYPLIKTSLSVNGSVILLNMLQKGELDVVFATVSGADIERKALNLSLLSQSDLAIAVSKSHPLANRTYVRAEDLDNESLLSVSHLSNVYPPLMNALEQAQIRWQSIGENSQTDVSLQVAATGLGISFVTTEAARFHDDQVAIIPFIPAISRSMYLVTRKNKITSDALGDFESFVRDYFQTRAVR